MNNKGIKHLFVCFYKYLFCGCCSFLFIYLQNYCSTYAPYIIWMKSQPENLSNLSFLKYTPQLPHKIQLITNVNIYISVELNHWYFPSLILDFLHSNMSPVCIIHPLLCCFHFRRVHIGSTVCPIYSHNLLHY